MIISGEGPVRQVTLNRPDQLNSVSPGLHRSLATVWRDLSEDDEIRAVILTGAGRAFSAGGDFDLIARIAREAEFRYDLLAEARQIVREMVAFPVPIVAAVNGPAVGLGCSIAVLCDIILISDQAYFADPHVSLGVVAADGGVLAWPAYMSLARAKQYLYTGDRIDAVTAERIGLANEVVPHDELMDRAQALAARLAAQPRQALKDTKRVLNVHLERMISSVIDFAFAAESETFALPSFSERLEKMRREG
ncbi:enoyl-CoA hydratase [Mycobacterium sp. E2327]|nr:enoyl-CoA hydratase [Mycobacterium sp. E2327]